MKAALKFINVAWGIAFSAFFVGILYGSIVGPLPPAMAAYVSVFQEGLEAFLSSWLFFVVFVVGWIFAIYHMSRQSGWAALARRYRFTGGPLGAKNKFHTGSGRIGNVGYNNMVKVGVFESGLVLKVFFLFRPGHPCLQIPWHDIESIAFQNSAADRFRNPVVHAISSKLSRSKYAKISLKMVPGQNLTIPWTDEFNSKVPSGVVVHDDL
ncbi:hypothetical protein [Marinobacter bohaiensis]|uniref:hypothetical protein n=1 Tax=Marinobacter bohaiensis TaxID=2201898 RepID=UPI0013A69A1B|nr:hypothetical protein [Marinobacter bohaiensis]